MANKQIESLAEIQDCANNKKSLICPMKQNCNIPAAVVINMQGRVILTMIKSGLFVYEKSGITKGKK